MDLQQIMNQKHKDIELLNAEIKKVEEYRSGLISQLLKVTGSVEMLQAMIKAETESQEKKDVIAVDPTPSA